MTYRNVIQKLRNSTKFSPKARTPYIFFPNNYIRLHVPSVLESTNTVIFYIPLEMTKPELRSYLENYYGIDNIERIDTTIKLGRKRRSRRTGKPRKKDADEKKAYVHLSDYVELDFTEELKKEIMRFYDPTRDREYWEERDRQEMAAMRNQAMEEFQQKQEQGQQQQQQQQPALEAGTTDSGASSEKKE